MKNGPGLPKQRSEGTESRPIVTALVAVAISAAVFGALIGVVFATIQAQARVDTLDADPPLLIFVYSVVLYGGGFFLAGCVVIGLGSLATHK